MNNKKLIKTKDFEELFNCRLEKGLNIINKVITDKQCIVIDKSTQINITIKVIRDSEEGNYCYILSTSFEGVGVERYESVISEYIKDCIDKICNCPISDLTFQENETKRVIVDINSHDYKPCYREITYLKTKKIVIVSDIREFYSNQSEFVFINLEQLRNKYSENEEIYLKYNNKIYHKQGNTLDDKYISRFKDSDKYLLIDEGLYLYYNDIFSIKETDMIEIEGLNNVYFKDGKLYNIQYSKCKDDEGEVLNFNSQYYMFINKQLIRFIEDTYYNGGDILDYSEKGQIQNLISFNYTKSYYLNYKHFELQIICIEEHKYVIKRASSISNTNNLFFYRGKLYEILFELNELAFEKELTEYGDFPLVFKNIKNVDKWKYITQDLEEICEFLKDSGQVEELVVNKELLDIKIPDLIGREVKLKSELSESSKLAGISAKVVNQYKNKYYVTLEYFGYFKVDVNIRDLYILPMR